MSLLSSQIVGRDQKVLLIRLPANVVDEQVGPIRDEVRARLPRSPGAGMILDFSAVELINSIGITCLLQIEEDCRRHGAALVLAALPAPIAQFLRQLKLDRKFQSRPTVDDALDTLESATR